MDGGATKCKSRSFDYAQDDKSQAKGGPEGVDFGFSGAVHFDHCGPGAGEAFGLPFAGGVDAHL